MHTSWCRTIPPKTSMLPAGFAVSVKPEKGKTDWSCTHGACSRNGSAADPWLCCRPIAHLCVPFCLVLTPCRNKLGVMPGNWEKPKTKFCKTAKSVFNISSVIASFCTWGMVLWTVCVYFRQNIVFICCFFFCFLEIKKGWAGWSKTFFVTFSTNRK